jgi:F0F1-type ATP synthase assembly protein I
MDKRESERNERARDHRLASRATSAAIQMVSPIVLGWWLDGLWKTTPWLLITGAVLGFATGMVELVGLANRSTKRPRRGAGSESRDVGSSP